MATKRGLGRGLGALINDGIKTESTAVPAAPEAETAGILRLPLARIRKNSLQPRHAFDAAALAELTASIREHGVLQPLLVRRTSEGDYELVAGERRLRASTDAGLADVPVIVIEAADRDALELALIENLQREDLNVLEEAEGYRVLADSYGMTQEQIAERVGKSRASVANALRLLKLPEDVRELISDKKLSPGHAKVLSSLAIPAEQSLYAKRAIQEEMSVRGLEKTIEQHQRPPRKPRATHSDIPSDHLAFLSDRLHSHFGTSVHLSSCRTYANGKKGKGSIQIDFYSNEDLTRILELLGIDFE